ncbi:MFS transporter [Sanguibacter gelidistatuariae]|uniref:MFS transporter n=1 Tax=Sanguibacter gelidistatuariae TaxID=1814289 RepID=UPI001FDF533F|nr:MFS transporter [Sanguibacter gelidistatuariae]
MSPTSLIHYTGTFYFPIAFVARLPFAMMVVGVLTAVVSARGSLSFAGLSSAMVGLGTAVVGPLLGASADRFGQRVVLLLAGVTNGLLLVGFAWAVNSTMSNAAILAIAFVIGTTAPQVGPMSRTRLVRIISERLAPARKVRSFNSTMAYESAADETVFIVGPFLVGLLASMVAPWLPLVAAGVLTIMFVTAFALHPTSTMQSREDDGKAEVAPLRSLAHPGLVSVVVGILGVGLFFGATLTSLTAFMNDQGTPERAGLVYGVMGVGSAGLALAVALFPTRFTLRARWLVFSSLILAGTMTLPFAGSVTHLVMALAIIGVGVGPTLVTQYSIGSALSPAGRSTTVMTILGSAVIVGQSLGSAITGAIGERFGSTAALALPSGAASLVVLAGVSYWFFADRGVHGGDERGLPTSTPTDSALEMSGAR